MSTSSSTARAVWTLTAWWPDRSALLGPAPGGASRGLPAPEERPADWADRHDRSLECYHMAREGRTFGFFSVSAPRPVGARRLRPEAAPGARAGGSLRHHPRAVRAGVDHPDEYPGPGGVAGTVRGTPPGLGGARPADAPGPPTLLKSPTPATGPPRPNSRWPSSGGGGGHRRPRRRRRPRNEPNNPRARGPATSCPGSSRVTLGGSQWPLISWKQLEQRGPGRAVPRIRFLLPIEVRGGVAGEEAEGARSIEIR